MNFIANYNKLQDKSLNSYKFGDNLSGLQLKILASISMLLDHIGAILYPDIAALRVIGRLAFPIYSFLLVQGFLHTRNIKKYLVRIGVFVLISELPFDMARTGHWFDINAQNIYVTLFLGLCCMVVCQWAEKKQQPIIMICGVSITCAVSQIIRADYQWLGVAIIMIFYLFRNSKLKCYLSYIGITGTYCLVFMTWLQSISIYALAPIYLYNGKRGRYSFRYVFYLFYPVHLLILFIIAKYVFHKY